RRGLDDRGCPDTDPTDNVREMIRIGSFCVDAYEMSLTASISAELASGALEQDACCTWPSCTTCLGAENGSRVTGVAQSKPIQNALVGISWFQAAALCAN